MTGANHDKGPKMPRDGYVVPRPRRTDDIGRALCDAFDPGAQTLPNDIGSMLAILNRAH